MMEGAGRRERGSDEGLTFDLSLVPLAGPPDDSQHIPCSGINPFFLAFSCSCQLLSLLVSFKDNPRTHK